MVVVGRVTMVPVCDDTQNLNETESETFFRYQIFPIPNPILFYTNFFLYRIRYFFDTKLFDAESETTTKMEKFRNRDISKPKHDPKYPKYERNQIQNFVDTESDTFSDTNFLGYWNRYFIRYQICSIPNPKPLKKWKSFETEKFRNRKVTLWMLHWGMVRNKLTPKAPISAFLLPSALVLRHRSAVSRNLVTSIQALFQIRFVKNLKPQVISDLNKYSPINQRAQINWLADIGN